MKILRKIFLAILIVVGFWLIIQNNKNVFDLSTEQTADENQSVLNAVHNHLKGVQVRGNGKVSRILSDDNYGDRHQRFILRLDSGHTVLIAHNIDIAPRVKFLERGDVVQFYGEFEWNSKGGVIHWTHHDPNGHHKGGWLKHNSRVYK